MVVLVNAIVVSFLSVVIVAGIPRKCDLELPTNGSHDVYCDVMPYRVDLSRTDGMTKLDVSENNLNAIYIASDKNLTLPTLDLSRNNIPNPCYVFTSNTVRVDSMILSFNKIKHFSMCSDTRNMTLSWNGIKSLNRADMANASSLEILDLANNFILWIENDTFVGMPELQWLDLRGNVLSRISEKTLPSTTLRYLDVSENPDLDRWTVFQPFENLVELRIARNAQLAPVVLGSGPRLKALDASHANLTAVPVTPAPLLGSLVLSGNVITAVNSGDLDGFPLLRFLNISGNRIATVEDDAFGRLYLLTVLDLSDNSLETLPKSLPERLETLNVEGNRIETLAAEDFEGCKRLRTLNVRRNNIRHVQDLTFASLPFLDVLDVSENPIEMITREMLTGPVRLKVLKLEMLTASETPAFPFTDTRYLNRIHLAHSGRLAAVLLNDTAVLSSMFELEYLDLTGCSVPRDLLSGRLPYFMPKMKTLITDRLECTAAPGWLEEWLCDIRSSGGDPRDLVGATGATELRLRNGRAPRTPAFEPSPVYGVRCTRDDGEIRRVFDPEYCDRITATTDAATAVTATATTATTADTITTTTTEQAAVFARLRAKDDAKNARTSAETARTGVLAFACAVSLFAMLACGAVWIGIRGDAFKRLRWRQRAPDVDYQSIEIKSLDGANHVERW